MTEGKGRKGQFLPGNTIGKKGRPKDPKSYGILKDLLISKSPAIVQKVIDLALDGDTTALKICVERLVPTLRPIDAAISLSGLAGTESLTEKGDVIFDAMAAGKITPSQTAMLLGALGNMAKIEETTDLIRRIKILEGDNVVIESST